MYDVSLIDKSFPMPSYRDGQREAIEFAVKAFANGKQYVILECPTGSGKSAIGMTVSEMVDKSYYLTSTKILQDQLVRDFGNQIVELKGKNAYPCTFIDRNEAQWRARNIYPGTVIDAMKRKHYNCSVGACRSKVATIKNHKCIGCFSINDDGHLNSLSMGRKYSECLYYEKLYTATVSRKVVMNFSSFMYQTAYNDKRFGVRDLLVIDEAHNTEKQILDFVSLTFNDLLLNQFNIFIPPLNSVDAYKQWIEESKILDSVKLAAGIANTKEDWKLADELNNVHERCLQFMESDDVWVHEYNENTYPKKHRSVTFKPVFVDRFAERFLRLGERVLMMSATILDVDVLCRSLGIERNTVAAYRMANRFPKENRPVYIKSVAKCTGGQGAMQGWMPKLVKATNDIVNKYAGKRGIIHTHNFTIAKGLLAKCERSVRDRFVFQEHFNDKSDMLAMHAKVADSVIVAPAMHEGLDLKDDLSRFQIVCKVPYPNFYEDKQLAARIECDDQYYGWVTALKLIQCIGRSVRSETDYADTYILDSAVESFIKHNKNLLPSWFTESLIYE